MKPSFCFLALLFNKYSHGFVMNRPYAKPVTSSSSSLHLLDPSTVLDSTSTLLADAASEITNTMAPPEAGGISYSKASYYTILGLYLLSFPGLWSTIKRSTKAKVVTKTFETPGINATDTNVEGKGLRQQAGEIMACKLLN